MRGLLWDILVLLVVMQSLNSSPFTKVEESFNMQAVHDVLVHKENIEKYDHLNFPGAVPRTFAGATATATLADFFVIPGAPRINMLYATRGVLGFCAVVAHGRLRAAIALQWGATEAALFAVITALQFHLPFYMSRPLPNTYALILANLAFASALNGYGCRCLAILASAAAIFRCDLLLVIAPMGLLLLWERKVRFFRAALVTALAALFAASYSVRIDSPLWGRKIWPELEVLLLNVVQNKSSEWGTSPALWYLYSALPRALLGALPLVPLGVVAERRTRGFALVAAVFVGLYSFLPHKELRFIFPALPLLNAVAAAGAARALRVKGALGRTCAMLVLLGLAIGTFVTSELMSRASQQNYPGGVAMARLHEKEPEQPGLSVHIGNLAATTGVTRFLEAYPEWTYSKEEGLSVEDLADKGFDRLLTEEAEVPGYHCQAVVHGFDTIKYAFPVKLMLGPKVFVLAKSLGGTTLGCDSQSPVWE